MLVCVCVYSTVDCRAGFTNGTSYTGAVLWGRIRCLGRVERHSSKLAGRLPPSRITRSNTIRKDAGCVSVASVLRAEGPATIVSIQKIQLLAGGKYTRSNRARRTNIRTDKLSATIQ